MQTTGADIIAARDAAPTYVLDDASFAVGPKILLAPISHDFRPGRVTGLIGHNGSGKSTLVKLLARQQSPSGGEIRLGGAPIAERSSRAFARDVAYLPQHTAPAPGLSVRELVSLGRYPWHGALGRFGLADAEAVETALRLTSVERFADRMVEELSGGERQRVWIAMLVAQDPRWLLLDEPTSALDVSHQFEVLALLRALAEARGLGVLVVLHDINMAARFCHEIVALRGGELVARGAPEDVMQPETLEVLFGIAMDVIPNPRGGAPLSYVR